MGTTWYFASDTELSALSNDSYTCGNGVKNNGTAVQETFKMNKYVEPSKFPPPGYIYKSLRQVAVGNPSTGTIDEAFEYVEAAPGPQKYYDNHAQINLAGMCKYFAKVTFNNSGRIAYYYNDTWYYGKGTCSAV